VQHVILASVREFAELEHHCNKSDTNPNILTNFHDWTGCFVSLVVGLMLDDIVHWLEID
jgi:hypothetical protein